MKRFLLPLTALVAMYLTACNGGSSDTPANDNTGNTPNIAEPPALKFTIVKDYPHDTLSFTQGLVVYDGKMYEGTGGSPEYSTYKSWVGTVDITTGKNIQKVPLDTIYFGEGITILKDKIYQLTWKGHKGFIYDAKSLKKLGEFPLKTEGWGITNDGTNLIVSDGSSNLYFLDPNTFNTAKIVSVIDNNGGVSDINELEYINGFIFANKWETNYIYKINPSNGQVAAKADFTGVIERYAKGFDAETKGDAVLNGIAYDSVNKKTYITGKLWPKLFEVKFE
jgi:glutamine cyclotransferase